MVSSAPSSPSLGGRRGEPGGQLLQELEALSQALYRSSPHAGGQAAPPPARREVPSPIRGGAAHAHKPRPPRDRPGRGVPAPAAAAAAAPQLSFSGSPVMGSRAAQLRQAAEADLLKNFDEHIRQQQHGQQQPQGQGQQQQQQQGGRVLQPWHSQGFEKQLPEVTNFPAWLQDNLDFSKKLLEAPVEKKGGWRSWKPFRALAHIGQQRFNCVFTLHVHGIEGMPAGMNGMRLAVACRRKEVGVQTAPVRVLQGAADFQETLQIRSTVYGSREGKGNALKYMSKSFTLSVVALDAEELQLGKHRLDLTKLLPVTLDGEDGGPGAGSSFPLTGKARGGTLLVSFGYEVVDGGKEGGSRTPITNSSSRFPESPTRRAVRSFSSLPNSASGTPRMRPSDAHLSPAMSEPDLNEYLGMEHLSLDESVEDKGFKLDVRPSGLPPRGGGGDMRSTAFVQQLEGKLKVQAQIQEAQQVKAAKAQAAKALPPFVPPPPAVQRKEAQPEYASSEEEPEFVVEDRGVELGTLPETVVHTTVGGETDHFVRDHGFEEEVEQTARSFKVDHEPEPEPEPKPEPEPDLEPESELDNRTVEPEPEPEPVLEVAEQELPVSQEAIAVVVEEPVEVVASQGGGGKVEAEEEEDEEDVKEVNSLRLELEKFEMALNSEANVEADDKPEVVQGEVSLVEVGVPLNVVDKEVTVDHMVHGSFVDTGADVDEDLMFDDGQQGAARQDSPILFGNLLLNQKEEMSPHDLADEVFLDAPEEAADLDDEVDLVAGEFLDMLESDEPAASIAGSDSNSPRALLLKQFEQELSPSMSGLGFGDKFVPDFKLDDIGEDLNLEELIDDLDPATPKVSAEPDATFFGDEDAELAVFMEAAETELKKADQAMRSKSRAKMMEDEETEALMAEWGLNEKAFEASPPKKSAHAYSASYGGNPFSMGLLDPPPLAPNIGSVVATRDGGSLRAMSPMHFQSSNLSGKLVMQVSKPVVVPAQMGSSSVDILRRMAASGVENMAIQAMRAMPLEDISGKSVELVASEGLMALEGANHRNGLSYVSANGYALPPGETRRGLSLEYGGAGALSTRGGSRGLSSSALGASGRWGRGSDLEAYDDNVSLEELAPMAMQKIESLAMEGLKIQAEMTEETAPYNVDAISWEQLQAIEGAVPRKGKGIGMLEGVAALPLVEGVRPSDDKQSGDVDGLMSMAISLEEWMRLDAGVYDEPDANENTLALLAAHHAVHKDHRELVVLNQKTEQEKTRGRQGVPGAKASFGAGGCMGDTLTLAMLVQLRDPLRNFEPVGAPMMALVQAERVLIPPKPRIGRRVSLKGNSEEEDEPEKAKVVEAEVQAPVFKITNVTMSGLTPSEDEKKKEAKGWGNQKQQQSGSRWLVANGMGKTQKHPAIKSKQPPSKTKVKQGESLWSISSRVHGTGAKWKEVAALNPHIRNPDVIFANETIRTR